MSQWKHNFGSNTFAQFVDMFFEGHPFFKNSKIFNKKLTLSVRDRKVVEIVLSTNGTHGEYVGFKLSIIKIDTGVIATEWFGFKDYLVAHYRVASEMHPYPKIIEHCGTDWYMNGADPKDITYMLDKMKDYINLYLN